MFRKITLALATTAALGAAALAPTSASAFGGHFGHGPVVGGHFGPHLGPHFVGGHFGPRFYGPRFGRGWGWGWGGAAVAAGVVGGAVVADTCLRREVIDTPYGPQVRWVNICY
jgi:hypothetical protein